ncbi:MAG: hypothetical protein NC080_07415 [Paraprevotella sp.]|nr:hypothetical protein [Paraprevotella sp.]
MSRFLDAAGYRGMAGSYWAPDRISTSIVYSYQICSITPVIARSDFLSDEDLYCGAKVIYGVEQDLDLFGNNTDNNEAPETISGPGIETDSMVICQSSKFEWKLSNSDKRMMCANFDRWESNVRRQISKNITRRIDSYSIPKVIASASPSHVGNNAGVLNHDVNLGWQDETALSGNTVRGFEDMILSIGEVATQAGWNCGEGEEVGDGESSRPVILIPLKLKRYALEALKGLNICCSDNNSMVTGRITSNFYGFEIIETRYLSPVSVPRVGTLVPVVAVDTNRVLHAFDVISNKWYEGKFEDYLVGEFVWDTNVIDPLGVIVAISKGD